jgi:hypothetical protein
VSEFCVLLCVYFLTVLFAPYRRHSITALSRLELSSVVLSRLPSLLLLCEALLCIYWLYWLYYKLIICPLLSLVGAALTYEDALLVSRLPSSFSCLAYAKADHCWPLSSTLTIDPPRNTSISRQYGVTVQRSDLNPPKASFACPSSGPVVLREACAA